MVDYWLPADICLCGVHVAEEIQLGLVKSGCARWADPALTTPEGFDTHVRAEVARFAKIVQDAGINPE